MSRKIEGLPRDGASSATMTRTLSRRKASVSGCVWLSCGVCFILCLISLGLVALVIAMDISKGQDSELSGDLQKSETSVVKQKHRLPSQIEPKHYDLLLHPILDRSEIFHGEVTILINVLDKRKTILLHQKDLTIKDIKLATYGLETDYEITIEDTKSTDYDMFMIVLKEEVQPGLYNLSMKFDGSMANKMVGFYSSKYKNKQGMISYIATTKFEPTYARQAFPCFDEPNLKATFKIQLRYKKVGGYHSLSNMKLIDEKLDEVTKETLTTFETSERMSTYLACFIISDFNSQTKTIDIERDLNVTVYTANIHAPLKSTLALDTAVQAIQYYTTLFKIDYPLPKLDLAAIPDFVSGAMENWGLVTFRETRLLHDPYNDSINHKHDVINVICHELAHMWFGNLVTMSWWNDLWLNEGFATYMSYKSANDLEPKEGHMDNFVVEIMHPVLSYDSTKSTHPIIYDVENPDEITSFFDDISYNKGACILRMIENFVGSDVFYGAINNYLNKYAYGNAETKDLLDSLQDAVDSTLNITDIINPWTKQKGYPLITVQKTEDTCVLTQQLYCRRSEVKNCNNIRWTIPITYITNKKTVPTLIWFDKNQDLVEIKLDEGTKWIKVNVGQVGYYRVNYTEWYPLISLLNYHHTKLSIADRVNLLDDIFVLAEDGHCTYKTAFVLLGSLSEDYSAATWETAYSKIKAIYNMIYLRSQKNSKKFANSFLNCLKKHGSDMYKAAGWTVEEPKDSSPFYINRRARIAILRFACFLEEKDCLAEANELFDAWLYESKNLHPDIRSLVYYYGLHNREPGTNAPRAWHYLVDRFMHETDPNEKNRIMHGLSGAQSEYLLNEFIELAKDEQLVRPQDFLNSLIMISKNPYGTKMVWNWVRANWEFLVKRYTLNDRSLGRLIPSITQYFSTEEKYSELMEFFNRYPEAGAGASGRSKAEVTVLRNQNWFKNHEQEIHDLCYPQKNGHDESKTVPKS